MLLDVLPRFAGCRVILASQSPRRVEILQKLKIPFEVLPSRFAEDMDWRRFPSPVCALVASRLPPVATTPLRVVVLATKTRPLAVPFTVIVWHYLPLDCGRGGVGEAVVVAGDVV